jgi:hypothetical protein
MNKNIKRWTLIKAGIVVLPLAAAPQQAKICAMNKKKAM